MKSMPIDLEKLQQIPLFAKLNQEDLAQVATMTLQRYYERGEIILLEGDMGGALHYVHSGLVKVFKTSPGGREQVLRLIVAGYTFNDVPALDGGPNPASAAAMEPTIVYVIRRAELRTLFMMRPEVAEAVVGTLAMRNRMAESIAWVLYCNIIPDQLQFMRRRWNLCRDCDYLYLLLFYSLTAFV